MNELVPTRKSDMQVATVPDVSIGEMMKAVIDKGVTADNAVALEKLAALYERMQDKSAEKDFTVAFNALQSKLPTIVAKTVIQNRGKYEKFEDVMHVVSPLLKEFGFTVSFSMDFKENRIIETCTLKHIGGHSQSNSFAVRSGKADSDTQADCKAATTAKRNALCNALNIVIRQDILSDEHDPRIEGGCISEKQALELESRLALVHGDKVRFLKLAGSETFAGIAAGKYDVLDQFLAQKEGRSK